MFARRSMAIAARGGNHEINEEEFKKWLKQFDTDGDNKISAEELRRAIKASGGWWFCGRKANRRIMMADKNLNGCTDDAEIENLVEFAQKYLGVRVTTAF